MMSAATVPWGLEARVISGVTTVKDIQIHATDPKHQSSLLSMKESLQSSCGSRNKHEAPGVSPVSIRIAKQQPRKERNHVNNEFSSSNVVDNSSESCSASNDINPATDGMKTKRTSPKPPAERFGSKSETTSDCYPDMSAYRDYLKPRYQDGDVVLEVECGGNNGQLYLSKLCQGSKGPCIWFRDMWLTPNEFQYVSGRETAKDWKRSIRHDGKSMKLLLSKGILAVHPPTCDCKGCRISSPVNRGRLAEKRILGTTNQNGLVSPSTCLENTTDEQMYEREEENSGYSDSVKDLVQKAKSNHQGAQTTMDTVRKQIHGESTSPEPKRESRLTSIIDQLLSNKTKDMHQTDDDNKRNEKDTESFCEKQSSDPESQDNDSEGTLNRKTRSTKSDTNQSDTNCGEKSFDHVIQTTRADQQLRCASTSPTRRSPGNYGSPSTCSTETQNKDYQGSSPGAQLENSTRKTSTEGIFPAGTDYKAPPGGGQQQQLGASAFSCSSSIISLNNDMPTDMLLTARDSTTLPVKPERLSPEFESSSPSVSPHSPNSSRAFPSTLGLGFGLRGAFPPSSPGLERCTSSGLACGASALKQMEMMTRNYSDFMRCLAAKYNNQNNQESFSFVQPNGIARPFETHLYKSGILGRTSEPSDNNSRKLESHHKLSPVLGENRTVPFSFGDFSSSQTLLNLVRTASAQSASQLENYLRGANKRPLESENKSDPLDLTMGTTKRPRLDTTDTLLHRSRLYSPISQNISDIIGCIKTETESLTSNHNDPVSKVSVRKTPSWSNLLDERISKSENSPVRTSPKSSDKVRCPSFCTDKSCSNKSNASEVALWTIDDVVRFVTSVESCAEYADNFREHSIDGTSLPLLNEDHLTTYLGMKLGPALKLRSKLAKKIGHCVVCMHCIHCHLDEYEKRNDITTSGK